MTRVSVTLCAAALLAGCSVGSPTASPDTPTPDVSGSACSAVTAPAVPADGAPTAVLRDLAGGIREFLIGSPGGRVAPIAVATGSSAPRLAGDRVFFSVGRGLARQEIRTAKLGECSVHLAWGAMSEVEPRGRALVVTDAGHSRMLSASGQTIAEVAGPSGLWTGDGHLALTTAVLGLKVYDMTGAVRDISLPPGSTPTSPLGPTSEIIYSPAGFQTVDITTGGLRPLAVPPGTQRLLGGSPDGKFIAVIGSQGAPLLVSLADGTSVSLPAPGPSIGVLWDRASRWVAVQSLYGAKAVRVADLRVIDMGPQVVVSW